MGEVRVDLRWLSPQCVLEEALTLFTLKGSSSAKCATVFAMDHRVQDLELTI